MLKLTLTAAAMAALLCGGSAMADAIPYPNPGTENPVDYTFKAATSGDVVAYFYRSTAAFDEDFGLFVNGKNVGSGLDNRSTANGTALDFGKVKAGSSLDFYINVKDFFVNDNPTYYTEASLNPGGTNQVYSTAYSGGAGIPPGTYLGFEDLNPNNMGERPDFNYADTQFVVTNVATSVSAAPEPSTWLLMFAGIGGIGLMMRRAKKTMGSRFKDAFSA